MKRTRWACRSSLDDSGAALVITLMVMALVAALTTTVATLTIRNLQSARLSQQGGVAVGAAGAGVAQAVSFLRVNGVNALCPAATTHNPRTGVFNSGFDLATQTCVTNLADANNLPNATPVPGQPYRVVIVTRAAYPTNGVGSYTVYSKGVGAERAARFVAADITVTGGGAPRGSAFFGNAILGSGNVTVNQSVFTTGCVYNRRNITMNTSGRDAYGLPPAFHSAQIITDDNGSTTNCVRTSKAIHNSGACAPSEPFDQDALGGSLAATGCASSPPRPSDVPAETWAQYYPEGSKISSPQMLLSLFGIKNPPLSQADIDRLRAIATSQGNFKTSASNADVWPSGSQAVLFYDLTNSSGNVNLNTIRGFGHTAGSCPNRSLVVVVVGGGTVFPSGAALVASVFVTTPDMTYSANGGVLVGAVYADKISLGGNAISSQEAQKCADSNPSPTLLDFNVTTYREIDGVLPAP
jgi:Tfp pilus assembly protein PilX